MRISITQQPFHSHTPSPDWITSGRWPCQWIHPGEALISFPVVAYRLQVTIEKPLTLTAHISADERYELFLDGSRQGRGPERGDQRHWFYDTYQFTLPPGTHTFVARGWALKEKAPLAQFHIRPAFLFAVEPPFTEQFSTGHAPWQVMPLNGYSFTHPAEAFGTGHKVILDGSLFPWGFHTGEGQSWQPAPILAPAATEFMGWGIYPNHRLSPAPLPPMFSGPYTHLILRSRSTVPSPETDSLPVAETFPSTPFTPQAFSPHTTQRLIIDLENYVCAYPSLTVNGGAGSSIRLRWAESLFTSPNWSNWEKGSRDEIDGKFFHGVGDTFLPDGGSSRRFDTLWWQAGRYLELIVQTAAQPLHLHSLELEETHYPFSMQSSFRAADPRPAAIIPIFERSLQMCAHETYMDCPYYEQLMYVGDTRLEVLSTYILTRDERLPRKALSLFESSRLPTGLTQARYPCRETQLIAPFSLWWACMVKDFLLWRGDVAFVRSLLPGIHSVLEAYAKNITSDDLLLAPEGWNVMDWVPSWEGGIPPDGLDGISGVLNWQYLLVLSEMADLEQRLGDLELSRRIRRKANRIAAKAFTAFWDESRGLLADDLNHQFYSEHTQCMAVLSGLLTPAITRRIAENLTTSPGLAQASIYFSHYLLETYRTLGLVDAFYNRLEQWYDLPRQGFKTTYEMPSPTRSDCHAWGAHPLHHYFASILGIRPVEIGFQEVEFRPMLGSLSWAAGTLVHPRGQIEAEFNSDGASIHGLIILPEGVSGKLMINHSPLTFVNRIEF